MLLLKKDWININNIRINHLIKGDGHSLTYYEFVIKYIFQYCYLDFFSQLYRLYHSNGSLFAKTEPKENINYQEEIICIMRKETLTYVNN